MTRGATFTNRPRADQNATAELQSADLSDRIADMPSPNFPPTILALETSTEHCSCALLIDDPAGVRLCERGEHAGQAHSERILPMAAAVLAEAGIELGSCSAIAYGAGPGSFTGLRIACAVAQGLAYGADLPVLGVGNLMALCEETREETRAGLANACPPGTRFLAAQDARMGEVYWSLCEWAGDEWREIVPPALTRPDRIAVALMHADCGHDGIAFGCGNAFRLFAAPLVPLVKEVRHIEVPGARWIAQLALRSLQNGQAQAARDAAPLYVRDRVALTTDERALGLTRLTPEARTS